MDIYNYEVAEIVVEFVRLYAILVPKCDTSDPKNRLLFFLYMMQRGFLYMTLIAFFMISRKFEPQR